MLQDGAGRTPAQYARDVLRLDRSGADEVRAKKRKLVRSGSESITDAGGRSSTGAVDGGSEMDVDSGSEDDERERRPAVSAGVGVTLSGYRDQLRGMLDAGQWGAAEPGLRKDSTADQEHTGRVPKRKYSQTEPTITETEQKMGRETEPAAANSPSGLPHRARTQAAAPQTNFPYGYAPAPDRSLATHRMALERERRLSEAPLLDASAIRRRHRLYACLLYTSPSPRDGLLSRMPSSA